jgi:hypothetical protein
VALLSTAEAPSFRHLACSSSDSQVLIQVVSVLTSGVCCQVDGSDLGAGVKSGLQVVVLGWSPHFSVGSWAVIHSLSKVMVSALSSLKLSSCLPTRSHLTLYFRLL